MASSTPSDRLELATAAGGRAAQTARQAAVGASDTFDDDNDYDKLNDEDWQDMPAAPPLPATLSKQSSFFSPPPPDRSASTPTPLLPKTGGAAAESSGSRIPVHVRGDSDSSLRLRLDDHLRSTSPSVLASGPDSPPMPNSAGSSSSEFSLLNPSVASSVDQNHNGSISVLSTTSSDHRSPSLLSLTPTSTVPSPSIDQQLPTPGRSEEMMSPSTQSDLQDEVHVSRSTENTHTAASVKTMAHPAPVHTTRHHPPSFVSHAWRDDETDVTTLAQPRMPGDIPLATAAGVTGGETTLMSTITATEPARPKDGENTPSSSTEHVSAAVEDKLIDEQDWAMTGDEANLEETVISAGTTPPTSLSTPSQEAGSSNVPVQVSTATDSSPSPRMHRTTVEDAPTASDEEGVPDSSLSGVRRRRRDPQGANPLQMGTSFSFASSQYAMPGALNLELENLGLESHFAAQSREEPSAPPPLMEERQCRICLGGADEVELGRLISPCMCKGSMKYVHVECLNEWRARSQKRESHYKCDTCKYEFSFRRTSFAKYLGHPATLFILTILVFVVAVFAAGFVMKLLMYLFMEEFEMPIDLEEAGLDDSKVIQMNEDIIVFRPPDSLRAVFRIDSTHMVFGSLLVSVVGFLQLLVSAVLMGGGGHVFQIGGFGLGGRRRGGRGGRQGEAGISTILLVMILVFGLFKSLYVTYQFVHRQTRKALAKAETMVLDVQ